MKSAILLLIALVTVGVSSDIYSYPYDTSEVYGEYEFHDMWVCDDFTAYSKTNIQSVVFYGFFLGAPIPMNLNLKLSWDNTNDNDPNNDILIWEDTFPCSYEYLCERGQFYSVYAMICDIPSGPQVLAGRHYYMHVQFEDVDSGMFQAIHKNGSYMYFWYEGHYQTYYPTDFFMVIGDEELTLRQTTWATIKGSF
jgi:hypothetical protein